MHLKTQKHSTALHSESPKTEASAACTVAMEPAAVPNGAAAAEPAVVVREQDRLMPIANVIRIMRRVLPPHAKISDDAKELIQECVSEFISFVTGEANERCHGEHRKTVTAEDVVWAMDRLGFDDYVMPLSVYLQRMRDCDGGGGDHRAVPRAPPVGAAPGHGVQVQVQMRQAHVYAHPAPAQAYAAVAMPPVPANALAAPRVGAVVQQYDFVAGGQRSAAPPYYGEVAPYGAGGGRGGCADEASSSSAAPAPAVAGTGSQ